MLSCSFLKKLKTNPFFIQLIFSFIKKKSVYLEKNTPFSRPFY